MFYFIGEVVLVAGGYQLRDHGPTTNTVEIFSPNGKCNFFLTPLPKSVVGAFLVLYDGRITVCGGQEYSGAFNQVKKQQFYITFTCTQCFATSFGFVCTKMHILEVQMIKIQNYKIVSRLGMIFTF